MFNISTSGFPEVGKSLAELAERAKGKGLQAVSNDVHRYLLRRHEQLWRTEGQSVGRPWPSYRLQEPKYGRFKAAVDGGGPLRWKKSSERLYPSVTKAGHAEHVFRIQDGRVVFGTSVPYAEKHQKGKGVNRYGERIPERRIVDLGEDDSSWFKRFLAAFILSGQAGSEVIP